MVRRPDAPGFTLIELMVTIAIIAIAMAISIPSVMQAVRDRRLHQQAVNFTNVFRLARSRATMRGAAHLLTVDLSVSPYRQDVVEGTSSSCLLSTFPAATAAVIANDMLAAATDVSVTNTGPGSAFVQICYSPSGRAFYRLSAGGTLTDDNGAGATTPLNGGFMYEFASTTEPATVHRRVFVPLTGAPRLAP